jgi:hypothetical protein
MAGATQCSFASLKTGCLWIIVSPAAAEDDDVGTVPGTDMAA